MSEYSEEELTEGFEFLDDLRESGVTNMFGAPTYMVRELIWPVKQAQDIWSLWTQTFHLGSLNNRVAEALNLTK